MAQVLHLARLDGDAGEHLRLDLFGSLDDAIGDRRAVLVELILPQKAGKDRAAKLLLGRKMPDCAGALVALGCAHVLVTGTHEGTDPVVNTLYGASGVLREDRWPRLPEIRHAAD